MHPRPEIWRKLSLPKFLAFAVAAAVICIFQSRDARWVPILDDANLMFHEAGHPIFGVIASTLGVYGGTLGQLFFPSVVAAQGWFKKESAMFAVGGIWFAENLLNIGRYMSDAQTQALPLLGGGEHDWTLIFSNWSVLQYDTAIGGTCRFIGYAAIAGILFWMYFNVVDSEPSKN